MNVHPAALKNVHRTDTVNGSYPEYNNTPGLYKDKPIGNDHATSVLDPNTRSSHLILHHRGQLYTASHLKVHPTIGGRPNANDIATTGVGNNPKTLAPYSILVSKTDSTILALLNQDIDEPLKDNHFCPDTSSEAGSAED